MSRRPSVVDLTSAPGRRPPAEPAAIIRPSSSHVHQGIRSGSSRTGPRGIKRRREDDPLESEASDTQSDEQIESIDLTEIDSSSALAKTLAKQREDAIKAQQSTEEDKEHSVLSAYKCPVCMDTPEDATSTACGHLFCNRCIHECLSRADEQRFDSTKQVRGTCPVCRKPLTRNQSSGPRRSLIPLQIQLTTKKRGAISATEA
ncbi:uncharacterized protein N7459_003189 [Penicillium hispanicum]|uniref:uncharacterized protein n=1 Tax=Penicillium hispanicum TaxID=1080232 RepID=UPI00254088C4|nr:uncharacterized protein N7459_003189 [Penicillium hispanicum]KAJ5587424.1 hypothetical protein N7459_003189 [Penicillium hispanicum]